MRNKFTIIKIYAITLLALLATGAASDAKAKRRLEKERKEIALYELKLLRQHAFLVVSGIMPTLEGEALNLGDLLLAHKGNSFYNIKEFLQLPRPEKFQVATLAAFTRGSDPKTVYMEDVAWSFWNSVTSPFHSVSGFSILIFKNESEQKKHNEEKDMLRAFCVPLKEWGWCGDAFLGAIRLLAYDSVITKTPTFDVIAVIAIEASETGRKNINANIQNSMHLLDEENKKKRIILAR